MAEKEKEKKSNKKSIKRGETVQFKHNFTKFNPGKLDECYDCDKKQLGEGSYGVVTKGKDKNTGAIRAIKSIAFEKISNPARFQEEVIIQQSLDHPNIVKLYETFKDAKYAYLVMELCTGGELFDRIVAETEKHDEEGAAFDETGAATYMTQIMGAMQYIHSKNFVHRDIKPENFLLQNKKDDAQIKVIDFGLAKKFVKGKDPNMKTKAGTPYYVAPQVLGSDGYDEKCDIWSCGVIAYILLCGYPPFYGDDDQEILMMVKKGNFEFLSPDWDSISDDGKDFISQMLTMNPEKRPSAEACLKHAWVSANAQRPKGTLKKEYMSSLRKFRCFGKFKKVALTAVAQLLKDEEINELQKTFRVLDANQDGTLTAKEIREGMKKNNLAVPDDLDDIIRQLDSDGSGVIDYTEFIAATLSQKEYLKKETLWAAFRTFDHDNDASITREELEQVLRISGAKAEEMIRESDLNGDGKIQFDEFCKLMEKKD